MIREVWNPPVRVWPQIVGRYLQENGVLVVVLLSALLLLGIGYGVIR